ncbi:prepilin-type N-terminal cleavage/methylation domain-containing protein [Chromatiaceae bacterium AAb-1]|nr:prepilin-type N-terminal cleavage/methylation domain-containing protein [Chromatiaceae bacterium AAb-1]
MLKQRGVTLIELLAGIVVLGIALTLITAALGPLYVKTVDPWHQVRAAELGQSLMNEILSRRFDKNSFKHGSLLRCGEGINEGIDVSCSPIPDHSGITDRSGFTGVEDYNGYTASGDQIIDAAERELTSLYREYKVKVTVFNAGAELNLAHNLSARRITVTVTTPAGSSLDFTAYKGNW